MLNLKMLNFFHFLTGFFVFIFIFGLRICDCETPDEWTRIAEAELDRALKTEKIIRRPKNVIFFLGDGMGISTLTASRIYKGQLNGKNGEEESLVFEQFPHVGLIKTYNDDSQVPDSAGSATAFFSGQKAAQGVLGVNSKVRFENCSSAQGNSITSILEWAQKAGKATGIVTTTTISHATPAGTYAHTPSRDWETDKDIPEEDRALCKDIARQLVEDHPGKNIRVIFGGGRRNFLPANGTDKLQTGRRTDGRHLINEWKTQKFNNGHGDGAFFAANVSDLNALDPANTNYVLGLFAHGHLEFDLRRNRTASNQPSLSEMTKKSIEILKKYENGFFLMVEGGRIDHGHHDGIAKLALHDTVAFDLAIATALAMLPDKDTLFVVTADHSHTLTIGGSPVRGNPILKLTGQLAKDSLPFTTLSYANGLGGLRNSSRRNLTEFQTDDEGFMQDATIPLPWETHGGEDVAIYAKGPFAHLFHSLHEQHYIPVAIDYAACYRSSVAAHCLSDATKIRKMQNFFMFFSAIFVMFSKNFI